jgi:CHAD domain-containing protein
MSSDSMDSPDSTDATPTTSTTSAEASGTEDTVGLLLAPELEWTLDVPADLTPSDVVDDAATIGLALTDGTSYTLDATYFDTSRFDLARRGATLRRREGGVDAGWHLKLPARTHSRHPHPDAELRDEVMLPLSASSTGPPAELARIVRAWTLDAPMVPIAIITTRRSVHTLRDAEGRLVGELADDDVTALRPGDDGSEPLTRFRQWEVEARPDGATECAAFVDALAAQGAQAATTASKLRRALADAGHSVPAEPSVLTLASAPVSSKGVTAGDAFIRTIDRLALEFVDEDHRVRLGQDDSVHRMRVASRRLRSSLRAFAPILRTEDLVDVRRRLRDAADALGAERDAEVAQQRLLMITADPHDWADGDPATAKFVRGMLVPLLGREQALARADALAAMDADDWTQVYRDLAALADDPPLRRRSERPASQVLPRLVGTQWAALRTQARAIAPSSDDEQWHRLRITAKHTRYAADSARPFIGDDARRLARRLRDITELLGELQDTVLLRATLDRLVAHGTPVLHALDEIDGRALYALGRLRAAEEQRAVALKDAFPALWDRASDRKSRQWLRI